MKAKAKFSSVSHVVELKEFENKVSGVFWRVFKDETDLFGRFLDFSEAKEKFGDVVRECLEDVCR